AGGAESMSMVPMRGHHFAPNPWLADGRPEAYTGMGLTAENVAREWNVSREDQDAFALRSHRRAVDAIDSGRFDGGIGPLEVESVRVQEGRRVSRTVKCAGDEGPRRDPSLEALAKLRPVFHARGTVTAGNSSQTSDGAAAVLVMERRRAEALGLEPLVR